MLFLIRKGQRICLRLTPGVETPGCTVKEIGETVVAATAVMTDATHLPVISVMTGAANVETGRGTTADEKTERRVTAMETGNENAAKNAGSLRRKMFPRGQQWSWTTLRATARLVAHATNAGGQGT